MNLTDMRAIVYQNLHGEDAVNALSCKEFLYGNYFQPQPDNSAIPFDVWWIIRSSASGANIGSIEYYGIIFDEKMNIHKSVNDLKHSINILEANVKVFYEGNISVYRVIAVQLWLLLCDKGNALIPRLFPNAKLHLLFGSTTKEQDEEYKREFGHSLKEGLVFQMPAMVSFNGKGGSRIEVLFDERRKPIELEEWLDQDLFNQNITIRQLINSVRNKESAHSDKNYDETLKFTKSIKLGNEEIHIKFIVAIGEYVLKLLKMALQGQSRYLS